MSPAETLIDFIVPSTGELIDVCIFIASNINNSCPLLTASPAFAFTSTIVPPTGEIIVLPPAFDAAAAAAPAAALPVFPCWKKINYN